MEEEAKTRAEEVQKQTSTPRETVQTTEKAPEGLSNLTIAIVGGVIAALAVGAIYVIRSK